MATNSTRSAGTQVTNRGIVKGNTLVGPYSGLPIDEVVDVNGIRRLAVDAALSVSGVSVDVDLDVPDDGVHIGNPSTGDILLINPDGSINVNTAVDASDGDSISIGAHPNQIFEESSDTLTTAAFEEIFTYTSTSNDTKIVVVSATASTPCTFRLKIGGSIKQILRSSPGERNVSFVFREHRTLPNAIAISVEAKVERLILTSYDTFTSLEGYLE